MEPKTDGVSSPIMKMTDPANHEICATEDVDVWRLFPLVASMVEQPEELALMIRLFTGGVRSPLMRMTNSMRHEISHTEDNDGASKFSMEDVVSMIIFNSFLPKSFEVENVMPMSESPAIACGSYTEFCIEPIQNCVGDRDALHCNPYIIAFSGDVPSLPADVRNCNDKIDFFRLESTNKYPGFVRMKHVGEMKYNWDSKEYELNEARCTEHYFNDEYRHTHKDKFSTDGDKRKLHIKGPAITFIRDGTNEDVVYSIYSPQWPTEAKDWFYRTRNYGWPTNATLHAIVNMGCHVVCAQHRDCKDDTYQWRLSFSLAEVVLLRSWTKTQQIVYHLLRFFAKKELIQRKCPKEKEVLCTYHLKTLMLWTCEQESPEWWNSSVIGLCSKLLHKLSEWLQRGYCPNYFIPKANLFHVPFYPEIYQGIVDCIQRSSNPEVLSQWFLYNYILPFCTRKGLTAYDAYHGGVRDRCGVSRFITFSNEYQLQDSFDENICKFLIHCSLHLNELEIVQEVKHSTGECKHHSYVTGRLTMTSKKSNFYLTSFIYMLRAANIMMCKGVSCFKTFLSNVMAILLRRFTSYFPKCNNFPNNYETRFDEVYVHFLRAQEYMGNMPASVSDPEFQLLSRLSVEYLRKSVLNNDALSETLRCAAFAYLAAICYVTSQYQTAIELCSAILTNSEPFASTRHPSSKGEPLSAGCLIFIDDVSNIIGYLLLCRQVLDTLLDKYSEINLDLRLTPEVFAHYIMIQSMQRMPQQLHQIWNKISGEFLMDALLMTVVRRIVKAIGIEGKGCMRDYRLCVYRRTRSVSELINHLTNFSLDEDISIQLLMECSLRKMTSLYEDAFKDLCCGYNTLAFCYRVVYHYSCRHYDEVMTLCEQILREPDVESHLEKYPYLNVMTLSPFSSYFDEDVQCSIGLQSLCHVLSPKHSNELCWHDPETQCSSYCNLSKCHSFVFRYLLGRHFLARYLQLRCLIDSNSSMTDILTAFGKLKCRLHFEYVVHKFLWQKLRPLNISSEIRNN